MSNPYDKQVGGDHYQNMKIQPAEFINKNEMKFAEGNAIKYICRHVNKGGLQDLQKAKHYIDMIIERDYEKESKGSSVDSGLDINIEDDYGKTVLAEAVSKGDGMMIRFLLDNGASVINGSFGKYYSPHSDWVRDAIAYAGKKDVLFVNAAGNDAEDLDKKEDF